MVGSCHMTSASRALRSEGHVITCLINPSGRTNKFMANDHFGEKIILLNKEKVRPSSNAKSDEFL